MTGRLLAGVELGGTKVICSLGSGPGAICDQRVIPTGNPADTLAQVLSVLSEWATRLGFAALGIGSFGPLDLDPASATFGRIGRTAKPLWTGIDVLGPMAANFAVPIWLDSDVNAAALAEARWGAGIEARRFAYVTIGTGVGVGFPPRSLLGSGWHAELGHVRVSRPAGDDRISVCPYHEDCVEGLASGKAIMGAMAGADPMSVSFDDPRWRHAIDCLGQLCHTLLCAGAHDRIAFGGGVPIGNPGLVEQIEASMRHSLGNYLPLPDKAVLVSAVLGAQAGPLGTIALADAALVGGSAEPIAYSEHLGQQHHTHVLSARIHTGTVSDA